jgi:DMSO/TMAO reductase YedYZ molybdopterin-dependent catalytic subunit
MSRMVSRSRFRSMRALVVSFLMLALAASLPAHGTAEGKSAGNALSPAAARYPEYLSLADGLHVTGTPVEVDAGSYRLKVDGLVAKPLELSLSEVRALPRERLLMSLTCPGFFTDEGYWTGVRLEEILRLAGYKSSATAVDFTSIDGSYTQSLTLAEVRRGTVVVAYQFDDRDFPVYHGFPLRIAAEGHPGSVWVKWLGSITVR